MRLFKFVSALDLSQIHISIKKFMLHTVIRFYFLTFTPLPLPLSLLFISLQVVFSLTIPFTSRGPSLRLSFTWAHRISSPTSRSSRFLFGYDIHTLPACLSACSTDSSHALRFVRLSVCLSGWRDSRTWNGFPVRQKCTNCVFAWPTGSKLLSLSVFSSAQISHQRSKTSLKAILGFYRMFNCCEFGLNFGLSYSNTPKLLASSLFTWEDVNVRSFTQHSIAIAYFDCIFTMCVYVWL